MEAFISLVREHSRGCTGTAVQPAFEHSVVQHHLKLQHPDCALIHQYNLGMIVSRQYIKQIDILSQFRNE